MLKISNVLAHCLVGLDTLHLVKKLIFILDDRGVMLVCEAKLWGNVTSRPMQKLLNSSYKCATF